MVKLQMKQKSFYRLREEVNRLLTKNGYIIQLKYHEKKHENSLLNFSNGDIKKLGKASLGVGLGSPVSKNQLLSSKIAGYSPLTDTHRDRQRKQHLETPFF